MRGARKVVSECARVKKGERTLIVTDPGVDPLVSMALLEASREAGSEAVVAIIARRGSANEDLPARVADMMLKSDVVICATSLTVFYTNAKREACRRGARFISMTGATLAVLSSGAIEADFRKQKPLVERLAKMLSNAKEISIRTAAGTHITASLEGRRAVANTGVCDRPGQSTGVPDIEAYVAPVEGSIEGVAVIDGTISGFGLVRTPLKLDIHRGIVRKITGGTEAAKLRKTLATQKDRRVYQVAEIGIGMNPRARLRGAIIEDESALGTAHFALGDNSKFGGRNRAPVHIDLVFRRPIIKLDGETAKIGEQTRCESFQLGLPGLFLKHSL